QSAWVSMRPDEPRVSRHSSQFAKASVSGSAPTPRRSPEASLFAMTMEASTSATTSRMSCASSALPRALRSFALRKGAAALSDSSRTLKEQLLWTRTFRSAEEVRHAARLWAALYNEQWLIERHGRRPPAAVRHQFLAMAQAA